MLPPPPPPAIYASLAGERALRARYTAALAGLPFPHHERLVITGSYGAVHVTMAGHPAAAPLLLWHAAALPGPLLLAAFAPLASRFRVIAPDFPCQPGSRSQPVVLDTGRHGYGRWCAEVVEGLGLMAGQAPAPAHLGVCLGGAALLDLAAIWPEAVGGAALVVPLGLEPGIGSPAMQGRIALQLLLPALLYQLLPCEWTSWLALCTLCDDPLSQDTATEFLRLAMRQCVRLPPPPRPFRDAQLRRLQAPTLLMAAELDFLGGGPVAAERARRVIPCCEAYILRGARHFISGHWVREATHRVAGFFHRHGLMQPHVAPRPQLPPARPGDAGAAAADTTARRGSAVRRTAQLPAAGKAAAGQSTALPAGAAKLRPQPPVTPALQVALVGTAEQRRHKAAGPAAAVASADAPVDRSALATPT